MASQSHATTEVYHAAKAMRRYGIQMTMLDAGGGQSPSLDGVVQKLSQGGRAECVFFNSNVAIIATTDEHTYGATADVYDVSEREFEADMRELALARMTHGEYVKHFIRSDAKPLVLDIRWLWGVEPTDILRLTTLSTAWDSQSSSTARLFFCGLRHEPQPHFPGIHRATHSRYERTPRHP